jgi:hypothetical protein
MLQLVGHLLKPQMWVQRWVFVLQPVPELEQPFRLTLLATKKVLQSLG